jgi:hypothetical protein
MKGKTEMISIEANERKAEKLKILTNETNT